MISVTVEVREHAVVRRVRITTESIEHALSIAGEGRSECEVRLVLPMDAERFSVGETRRTPEETYSETAFAAAA